MELINPRLTIDNADGPAWLVRMEHRISDDQFIDIRLALPRSSASLPAVQLQLLKAAQSQMTKLIDSLAQSIGNAADSP